ncbi:cation:proton antiporter [Leifsonia poae]|uniref:Peptidase n=1 Tax=Leifsonia poae TaxID=110933 RepID=A0A9W6HCW1_9MICO|nr:sodium:proton antiporter [Leifsonia poae]GLJ77793.1 peptidase [Leifsonia poae]
MEYALIGVIGIVVLVGVSVFSKQLGIATPVVLVVVGVAISFLPILPTSFEVPPWVILTIVLPPLLYSAAIQVPLMDFRRNIGPISVLSVVLVVVTAFVIGFILYAILPDLDLAAGIALGAVVSPTDAVAATAIAKRLGLPTRLVTVLEGESLVNDASALVLLKSAVAATAATVHVAAVAGQFALSVVIAIAIGLVVGIVTVFLRSRLNDPVLETAMSFAVPFIAYIPAESLEASGVLAVVVAGLYTGHNSARRFSAQARIAERLNWRTVQFLLENGVFLVMGVQLKSIISGVETHPAGLDVWGCLALGLLICVLLLVIRGLFIVPIVLGLRASQRRAEQIGDRVSDGLDKMNDRPEPSTERDRRRWSRLRRYLERRSADITEMQDASIGWRGGAVLTWAGMRGVVTLAAAQTLPRETPYSFQLILIAFVVALVTLLVQGGTLPLVIRLLKVTGSDAAADRRELAGLLEEMSEAGLGALENPDVGLPEGEVLDEDVVERVRQDTLLRVEAEWERVEREEGEKEKAGPHEQYRALRSLVLDAERDALLEARSRGNYPSRILTKAQTMLDFDESRMAQRENDA